MKVKVTQKEDFHFVGKGDSPFDLPIDAAQYVGGKGRGFRPPELLMNSIAGCMGIHTYQGLVKAGKKVEGMEVETDGERRTDYPKVYTKIMLKFRVKGEGLTDKDVKDAIEEALTKTCSIAVMVNQVAPISYEYEIE
ncbi:MAG: OsmC family protein [Thermoplasmata archaeon]|nr:OsmC family protein [Thermoplasmata archaeon]